MNQILRKKIIDADRNVPDTSELVKKRDYNAKITEIESKIPSICGLAYNAALAKVKIKILDFSGAFKKTKDIEKKIVNLDYDNYIIGQNLIS